MTAAGDTPPTAPSGSAGWAIAVASSVTIVIVLPMFLVGALAVQIRAELGLTVAGLGLVVAGHRAFTALIATRVGRSVERLGATNALRVAAALAAAAMLGIALQPRTGWGLLGWLLIAAVAFAFGQTAVNRFLSRAVPPQRRGIAFGLKQSSVPTATLLAGAAVPAVALTVGWRWAFAGAALVGLVVLVSVPGASSTRVARETGEAGAGGALPRSVDLLAVGFFLAMAGASPLGVFLVDHAVAAGFAPGHAGLLLSLGSGASIVARLVVGRAADRRAGGHLRGVAIMVGIGVLGYLALASDVPALMVLGTVVGFACGWGFNGLFWYAVLRAHPERPAAVTGRVMLGSVLGGLVGPLVFGIVADTLGYPVAWVVAALWAAAAASTMWRADRVVAEGR